MMPLGWVTFGILCVYLGAFFGASALASQAAGRSVWLFAGVRGAERRAAVGFRVAFAVTLCGPPVLAALPALAAFDPLWNGGASLVPALAGHFLAVAGAMLAFAAQASMGASWRVGVAEHSVGPLVTGGLYEVSRNPVFAGQLLLFLGVAVALPSLPTAFAALIFWLSACSQISSEERILADRIGDPYRAYVARVPRWLGWPKRDRS